MNEEGRACPAFFISTQSMILKSCMIVPAFSHSLFIDHLYREKPLILRKACGTGWRKKRRVEE
jgi:hypothetical protein